MIKINIKSKPKLKDRTYPYVGKSGEYVVLFVGSSKGVLLGQGDDYTAYAGLYKDWTESDFDVVPEVILKSE